MVTGQHRPLATDSNGIPRPVVKWRTTRGRPVMRCDNCDFQTGGADLALARLHVKTFPDHVAVLIKVERTEVWAETTDGRSWVEAVNEG